MVIYFFKWCFSFTCSSASHHF